MAANRVSTVGIEVLTGGASPNARVSTVGVEVLTGGGTVSARVSTVGVEVLHSVAASNVAHTDIFAGHVTITGHAPTAEAIGTFSSGELHITGYAPHDILATDFDAGHVAIEGYVPFSSYGTKFTAGHLRIGARPWYINTSLADAAAILAAGEGDLTGRVSQGAVLALGEITPPANASQAAALVFAEIIPGVNVSQAATLLLVDYQPCTTRRAQMWRIARRDGRVLTFTSFDQDLTWRGEVYKRCNSLTPSASENAADLGAVSNMELAGIISDDSISEVDIYGGLYDDAYVEVWLYSWGDVDDTPKRLAAGWMGNISQGEAGFSSEVLGPGQRLGQQALTDRITPACRVALGSAKCGFDIEAAKISGSVLAAFSRDFISGVFADTSNGYQWENGKIRFTSGENDGYEIEIKTLDFDDGTVELWIGLPYIAAFGDTFDLYPGCDKAFPTCKNVYGRAIDQRGFPDIPGLDEILKTPDAQY